MLAGIGFNDNTDQLALHEVGQPLDGHYFRCLGYSWEFTPVLLNARAFDTEQRCPGP